MKPHKWLPAVPMLVSWVLVKAAAAADDRSAFASPVATVVQLLQEIKARLQVDTATEQQAYDKYACWCETTTARKAAAIEAARTEISSLGQDILTQKGTVAVKESEIKQTTTDIQQNEEAQEQYTSIRQKQNAAFTAETAEMKQAIAALERAATVLHDATSGMAPLLLQEVKERALPDVGRALRELQLSLAKVPASTLTRLAGYGSGGGGQSSKLALLRRYSTGLGRGSASARYAPQSATIQGILQDMYSTFVQDLQSALTGEATQHRAFEAFMAAKQAELLQLQDKITKAEKVKAEAELMLAEALQAYTDAEAQLKADVLFFDTTKSACTAKTNEWKIRKDLHGQELQGIASALQILTSDEARVVFGRTLNSSAAFLQLTSVEDSTATPTKKAYQALRRQARRARSFRLAELAAKVNLAKVGHFDAVIQAIDVMMQQLKAEEKADIAMRDQCKSQLQAINSTVQDLAWKIRVSEATLTQLGQAILSDQSVQTNTIADLGVLATQMGQMNATRAAENQAFLAAKVDDMRAIELLTQARDTLAQYYANNSILLGPLESGAAASALLQNSTFTDDAPDLTFSDKGKRKYEAKGVVAILTQLIEDLQVDLSNAVKDEESAQVEYEKQYAAAVDLQAALATKKTNLDIAIAQRMQEETQETAKQQGSKSDLDGQNAYRAQIEPNCNSAEVHFAERREKRATELEGLRQAKEYLAGYQVSSSASAALVQAHRLRVPTGDGAAHRGAALEARHWDLGRTRST